MLLRKVINLAKEIITPYTIINKADEQGEIQNVLAQITSLALQAKGILKVEDISKVVAGVDSGKATVSVKDVLSSTKNEEIRVPLVDRIHHALHGEAPTSKAKAGGRANLFGEHVDYTAWQFLLKVLKSAIRFAQERFATLFEEGVVSEKSFKKFLGMFSMGGAIQNNYIAAINKNTEGKFVIAHVDAGQKMEFAVADLEALQRISAAKTEIMKKYNDNTDIKASLETIEIPEWSIHAIGSLIITNEMLKSKGESIQGENITLTSNVPHGAGLSESAANGVAEALIHNKEYNLGLYKFGIVKHARDSEHKTGSTCGWLDQALIVYSKEGQYTLINYGGIDIEASEKLGLPFITHFKSQIEQKDMQIVLINTMVKHKLAIGEYSDRGKELDKAFQYLTKILGTEIASYSLTLAELNAIIKRLDPSIPLLKLEDAVDISLLTPEEISYQNSIGLSDSQLEKIVNSIEAEYVPFKDYKDDTKNGLQVNRHTGLSKASSLALCIRRMRHQYASVINTVSAGGAAVNGDQDAFMKCLEQQGVSLRMPVTDEIAKKNPLADAVRKLFPWAGDFQITGANGAQDALIDIGLQIAKEMEANDSKIKVTKRMKGGGGGGNVVFFVDKRKISQTEYDQWRAETIRRYNEWGLANNIFESDKDGNPKLTTYIEPVISKGADLEPITGIK